jgi:hypothetical protein
MSWDMLPNDICIYILKLRNNIRNNASNLIQNTWRKYIISDIIAVEILLKIETDQYDEIMVSIPSTVNILKTSLTLCSGKFYLNLWKNLAERLYNTLKLYKNLENNNNWLSPEVVNYRKIKIQYNRLLKKFNFKGPRRSRRKRRRCL